MKRIVKPSPKTSSLGQIVLATTLILFFCFLICLSLVDGKYNRELEKIEDEFHKGDEKHLPLTQSFEIQLDQLEIKEEIGSGAFGIVSRAIFTDKDGSREVAVKKAATKLWALRALAVEIKILNDLKQKPESSPINLVNFVGAITSKLREEAVLYAVMDYCCHGSLENFLRENTTAFFNQLDNNNILGPAILNEPPKRDS